MTRVKICCIGSIEEAQMAIDFSASAIGLVAQMPSGPGVISDDLIRSIAGYAPPTVSTFLLTSETTADGIIQHHKRTLTNTIQIVDELQAGAYDLIRTALPAIKIVQVIHVIDEGSIDKALMVSSKVDAILLDSGNPNLDVKVLGGTGNVHNWALSRKIVEQVTVPVFLAGGLTPENVKCAIDQVHPFGVDVCSGVRSNKKLDPQKLEAFFTQILT
ncbi:MAG: phosphoribosylanthranilate isomerase [Candidatus Marinimicrobia bacterium]|nr:phosphoribosylanthranilate isomerase [Candidatus Neomarinimicrobiota bacterium]